MDDNNNNNNTDNDDPVNSIAGISNLHVKSLADLARLSEHLPIRWPELPRVPFFGSLLGFNDQWYRAAIALSVLETRWRGNRQLSPEEVQIVAGQTAKAVATMSYELPALIGVTWAFELRGRSTFRFPFYQPKPDSGFNPNVFPPAATPLLPASARLQGQAARTMWHVTRTGLYAALSHWALRTLFISYAMAVKNVEFERDPRLGDLRQAIHKAATERVAEQRQRYGPAGAYARSQMQRRSTEAEGTENQSETRPSDAIFQTPLPARPQSQSPPPSPAQQAPSPDYDDGLDGDDGFGSGSSSHSWDDASPVSPAVQRRGWQKEADARRYGTDEGSRAGGGSAWDRVRIQSTTANNSKNNSGWQPKPAAAGGWAGRNGSSQSSQAGETGPEMAEQKERELAQKQFDAMLERERSGRDER